MTSGRRRLRVALFLAVGLGATGLWLIAYGMSVFEDLDLDTIDARFSVRGEQSPPADLAVVKIDDVTFDELNLQWPFPRSNHGRVITRLKEDGAKVIAYDVQFSEPSADPEQDNAFMDAARAAGNVVFATTEVGENGEPNFLGGAEGIEYARTTVGNGNFDDDPGGIIRRVPFELDRLKSFAVVAAERATGEHVEPFSVDDRLVDYHGPVGTIPSVSFSRVLDGKFEPGLFKDKIVVVGPWAPSLQDVHPVSFGDDLMPGPEIQANAVATILDGLPAAAGARLARPDAHPRARTAAGADGDPALPPRDAGAGDRCGGRVPRRDPARVQRRARHLVRLPVRRAARLVRRVDRGALPPRGLRARAGQGRLRPLRAGRGRRRRARSAPTATSASAA